MGRREGKFGMRNYVGSSQNLWEANNGLGEAPKSCTRKEHESATNSIAKRGQGAIAPCRVKGQRPLWGLGQRPNSSTGDQHLNALNKGAGSEASLPVTLRVRRRAPKLLFPQDSVKNLKTAASLLWEAALFASVDLHFSGNSITCIAASPLHPLWRTPFGD